MGKTNIEKVDTDNKGILENQFVQVASCDI
jgi:hypothetical protein